MSKTRINGRVNKVETGIQSGSMVAMGVSCPVSTYRGQSEDESRPGLDVDFDGTVHA